jgi:protein-S-isoprenylcysteine O-methyltransferase Ste14
MGRLFTFEMSIRNDHKLISDGPYAWVRHPAYTGLFSIFIGLGLWHATKVRYRFAKLQVSLGLTHDKGFLCDRVWRIKSFLGRGTALVQVALVAIVSSGLVARIRKEDDALRKTFGKQWDEWATQVPYKLIPGIY